MRALVAWPNVGLAYARAPSLLSSFGGLFRIWDMFRDLFKVKFWEQNWYQLFTFEKIKHVLNRNYFSSDRSELKGL